ncbi:uncharacterized protein LOC125779232 [Bactrocera dorsalis]|uniref:Uncharacterized protein LOC125779232 n=1 Tax=Bactrocera dorsalis TaxID=27457 RepID=A0ABM3K2Y6_BACDO|nr:uncharacterized protein LOC125779232 [Bactrocera dorsalis]
MAAELERCREQLRNSSFREQSDPLSLVCSKVPPQLGACIRSSFINSNRRTHGRRYDNFFKTIASGVFFLSPVAYWHLKLQLDFPSESTLENFVTDWPRFPGCTQSSIKSLEIRSRGFTFEQKFVSVSCDEMSLKCHLQYDRKFDRVIGIEDYGDENRTSRLATTAMTIMVQGIGGEPWSHPFAYFFVKGSCKGDVLKKYIFEAITQLQNIGLIPCHFVCDQGTNFQNFASLLGVSASRPFFNVNGKEVYFFYDSPHLIKSSRNCLQNLKNTVFFQNSRVSWSDIVHFYETDSKSSYRCAHKLTDAHIYPRLNSRLKY